MSLLAARGRGKELPLLTTPLRSAFKVGMAPTRLAGSVPYFDKDWADFSDSTTNAVNDIMDGG